MIVAKKSTKVRPVARATKATRALSLFPRADAALRTRLRRDATSELSGRKHEDFRAGSRRLARPEPHAFLALTIFARISHELRRDAVHVIERPIEHAT
ncbi:MAG: hypothetical protein JOY90_33885 [Bradyrhizobium sp.]|uniref:hypothetical protein n=1 Tax=Bradyrhizobium sp. TaxID=376 RepID=UPI001E0E0E57|nr:hypothetical protein [Bradyrhizobium sp.]MBV9565407.1 hypothetical protein [Bradyrhizobium sp.]